MLKIINQRIDPEPSKMLVEAIFKEGDDALLREILAEQVHGSSFVSRCPV